MMYSVVALILMLASYGSAFHTAICDSGFIDLISPCVRNDAINIDVLAVLDVSALAWNVSTGHLCKGSPIRGVFRFTPEDGATVDSAFIQWGDGDSDMLGPLFPCGLLPGALGSLPHPPGALCATMDHTYAKNGEYPVGVFGVTDSGVESQREGLLTVHRCTPSVDIDLLFVQRKNTLYNRDLVTCEDVTAGLRATPDDDVYPITKAFGLEFPGLAVVWWGSLGVPANGTLSFFPIDGGNYFIDHPQGSFPTVGSWPVAVFAGTNEEQKQLESLVYVRGCII